jgi:hypothetical protein
MRKQRTATNNNEPQLTAILPGERAGIATAKAINKGIDGMTWALKNVGMFGVGLWRGREIPPK